MRRHRPGHLWQARFYSVPLDAAYCWSALAYVERNPVRARMVEIAERYQWSSAAARLGLAIPPAWLSLANWKPN